LKTCEDHSQWDRDCNTKAEGIRGFNMYGVNEGACEIHADR
jgi:hypothetical protein